LWISSRSVRSLLAVSRIMASQVFRQPHADPRHCSPLPRRSSTPTRRFTRARRVRYPIALASWADRSVQPAVTVTRSAGERLLRLAATPPAEPLSRRRRDRPPRGGWASSARATGHRRERAPRRVGLAVPGEVLTRRVAPLRRRGRGRSPQRVCGQCVPGRQPACGEAAHEFPDRALAKSPTASGGH
jgi:hypothetical protein